MLNKDYMLRAIELAKKGCGYTAPNPMVGAVIVKDNRIIGEGYHEKYGDLHAERNAIKHCRENVMKDMEDASKGLLDKAIKESMSGATIYVTLEPCCHHGKQPPCVDAIIEAGISRVVIGSRDPNPLVSGKGAAILREHGIEVIEDFMREECDAINPVFFHYITTKRPYVVLKYAMTLDGKIATHTGESKWITGEEARKHVHMLRHRYTGIMVGINTVLKDNPMLNCRIESCKDPVRIVCDTKLITPLESNLVKTAKDIRTIIATCNTDIDKQNLYIKHKCEVLLINEKDNHLDLNDLMEKLGVMQIDSILLEGGGTLNWSALQAGIVNKVMAYIAPKLFGGAGALSPIEGIGVDSPSEAFVLEDAQITKLGDDYLIESELKKCLPE